MKLPSQERVYAYSSTRNRQQRFHSASVGKLLTASLIFMAIEEGRLSLDTRISRILDPQTLSELFVVGDCDYQEAVTVEHLLSHKSGVNDYYSSHKIGRSAFVADMIEQPDVFWKPHDLLDYTRLRQKAVGQPGQTFFYSDTGYILLGLILEKVFERSFGDVLEDRIFAPCRMLNTTLAFYDKRFEAEELAPFYVKGQDIHLNTSLSCDFSGGGLSTTAEDLVTFLEALYQGKVVSSVSLQKMADFKHKFRSGLYYGMGMMQVRFGEFFFLLKKLPHL